MEPYIMLLGCFFISCVPKHLFQESLKHNIFVNTDTKQNFHRLTVSLAVILLGNIKTIPGGKGNEEIFLVKKIESTERVIL